MKRKRLGEVLRERGQISPADLDRAIEDQEGKLVHLGEVLLARGFVSKQDLAAALTDVMRVAYVSCDALNIDSNVLKLVPQALAERCSALPIETQGTAKLVMVIAEPQNLRIIDDLQFSLGMEVIARLGFRDEIQAAIEKWYGAEQAQTKVDTAERTAGDPEIEFISSKSLQRNVESVHEMQADLLQKSTPAVRLVASIINAAVNKHASDVHIEPQATDTVVRLRVDGMLRDYQRIPRSLQSSVVSRIKILADMDIAERATPHDGRFMVKIAGRKIDLRVATLPTQNGEKLVLRLLEADAPFHDFETLGFPAHVSENLEQTLLPLPQGMILVTGPTGSGKSTTLYSLLNFVRKPSLNITTVEEPVEYRVPGINQVEVGAKPGLTFASALRLIVRQDPDVIVIGEIRDKETAEMAFKAAQSGKLVLSTLHTNDSVSAITRLLDLAVPASQIASSVNGIVAQRLVRRLCVCHKVVPATPEFVSRLRSAGITRAPEMESVPVGCEACDLTGYKGRIGVYELLAPDDAIRSAIRSGTRNEEIRTLARQNGMKLMQEYGLARASEGVTTIEEILRVIPVESVASSSCTACGSEISHAFLFCPFCGSKAANTAPSKSKKRSLTGQGAAKQ